jgi:signal transduction histidine kinase
LVVRPSEIHGIVGCFLVCAVLIALGATNRRKHLQLNEIVAALRAEGVQRQRVEQELRDARDQLEQRVEERTIALSQALHTLEAEADMRKQREEQLRHLTVRLMTLQDEERRRIARELHDSAGQTLAAIKMAEALSALVDDALREIRTTSYLLHPPLLDEVGIVSASRWFVEGFAQRSGIDVTCEIAQGVERPARDCELVLFRVLQESLTNVHRHSGASIASVRLWLDAEHLKLEVADNGSGISKEHLTHLSGAAGGTGVGIAGMRARVQELGGCFDIASGTAGTNVIVKVPVSSRLVTDGCGVSSFHCRANEGNTGAD